MSIRRMMLFTLGGWIKSIILAFKTRVLGDGGIFEAETNLESQLDKIGKDLFDSASLVITPNGVKTSKLYSIKPNDGTGDLTTVRSTVSTRVNADGIIELIQVNVPNINYFNGEPTILVNPQKTNLILQSENFNIKPWTFNATISSVSELAPNGTYTATTVIDSSSLYRSVGQSNITILNNTAYTISIFIKKTTGSPSTFPAISAVLSGGTVKAIYLAINTTTGELSYLSGASGAPRPTTYKSYVESVGDYWRVALIIQDTSSNTLLAINIFPAMSTDFVKANTAAQGSVTIWGAQVEVGGYMTPYIQTTTAISTRNSDIITKINASDYIGQTEGTLYVKVYIDINKGPYIGFPRFISISDGTASNWISILLTQTNQIRCSCVVNSTSQALISNSITSSGLYKIAFAYKQNSFVAYVNGVKIGEDLAGEIPLCNFIALGNETGSNISPSALPLYSAALWKTALPPETLSKLTMI